MSLVQSHWFCSKIIRECLCTLSESLKIILFHYLHNLLRVFYSWDPFCLWKGMTNHLLHFSMDLLEENGLKYPSIDEVVSIGWRRGDATMDAVCIGWRIGVVKVLRVSTGWRIGDVKVFRVSIGCRIGEVTVLRVSIGCRTGCVTVLATLTTKFSCILLYA